MIHWRQTKRDAQNVVHGWGKEDERKKKQNTGKMLIKMSFSGLPFEWQSKTEKNWNESK